MKTTQQILGSKNLTGIVQDTASGVPNDIVSPEFMTLTKAITGDYGTYVVRSSTRQSSRRAEYGGKAHARAQQSVGERAMKLIHSVEEITHKPLTLQNLLEDDGSAAQRNGANEVAFQSGEQARLFTNLRYSCLYSMLANGEIYFDADGNIRSAAVADGHTVEYQVPADQKGNLGGIIGASWANAATDIVGQLNAIDVKSRQTTGLKTDTVYYGQNILGYLLKNESVKTLLGSESMLSAAMAKRQIPDGFMGKTWVPTYEAFYEDAEGTSTQWWGDDSITIAPKVSRSWYELQEGSYLLPQSIGTVATDAIAALKSMRTVYGMFSYATISTNTPSLSQVVGDTFLPIIKNPKACFFGDVTP